jgi:hypothetical protein
MDLGSSYGLTPVAAPPAAIAPNFCYPLMAAPFLMEVFAMGWVDPLKGKSRAQRKGPEGVAAWMPRPRVEAGCRPSRPLRQRRPEPGTGSGARKIVHPPHSRHFF